MKEINLKAIVRTEVGKEAVKKLRRQGLVPAVVYKGKNSTNIKIAVKDFQEIIHTKAGENVIINLELEAADSAKDQKHQKSKTTLIKEVQYHPVSADILHVDFNEISLTEAIKVKVPVVVKGEAQGVKDGGVLEHILWEVEVECLPTQIPENILVNVSALKIGDTVLVKDLSVPSGVKVLNDPETSIIALALPHLEKPEEAKPEEGLIEPEVITERKPKEEEGEAAPAEAGKEKEQEPEKEKGKKA